MNYERIREFIPEYIQAEIDEVMNCYGTIDRKTFSNNFDRYERRSWSISEDLRDPDLTKRTRDLLKVDLRYYYLMMATLEYLEALAATDQYRDENGKLIPVVNHE